MSEGDCQGEENNIGKKCESRFGDMPNFLFLESFPKEQQDQEKQQDQKDEQGLFFDVKEIKSKEGALLSYSITCGLKKDLSVRCGCVQID